MILIFISAAFCYYIISYQQKYIEGNKFTITILSGISEITAYAVSGLMYTFIGLKTTLLLSYIISIVCMVCLIVIQPTN